MKTTAQKIETTLTLKQQAAIVEAYKAAHARSTITRAFEVLERASNKATRSMIADCETTARAMRFVAPQEAFACAAKALFLATGQRPTLNAIAAALVKTGFLAELPDYMKL